MRHSVIPFWFFISLIMLASCQQDADGEALSQYDIEAFMESDRIREGTFNADGSKILYSSDASGISNVYEVDIKTAESRQLTTSEKESFYALGYVPGSSAILYRADLGGDERSHIFLLNPDGSSRDLTPGAQEKATFLRWNNAGSAFYYLSNQRDPRFFDLYKMEPGRWEPQRLYENTEGLEVGPVSEDENLIACTRNVTRSEAILYVFDRNQGSLNRISPERPTGNYVPQAFSQDGSRLFYLTNAGQDFMHLKSYDLREEVHTVVYETNWDVLFATINRDQSYQIIGVNEDGRTQYVVRNLATGKTEPHPALPESSKSEPSFSRDGKQLCMIVTPSGAPGNLHHYDLETQKVKVLTQALSPRIKVRDLVEAEVVRYPSFDGMEIPAIYYKPHLASAENKVPALVWVHGGPGGQSKATYNPLIQYLVNHGYAVLAVNNRGSSGYGKHFYSLDDRKHGGGDLKDCIWGKKWLAEHDYIDEFNIGIIGGSYGGFMVMAAMAFEPTEFKAGVNLFGVTNWMRTLKSIPPYWASYRDALYQEMGDPYTEDSIRLYNISPLFHSEQIQNPVMILQGANDPRVLQIESDEMAEAMKRNNVPVKYIIFPDEGHGFVKKDNQIQGYREIRLFLDTYLKPAT